MKNKPVVTGIIAVASPIPLIIFTVLWSWLWFFGIGIGLLNYDTVPQWILVCSLLPLFISPTFGQSFACKKPLLSTMTREVFLFDWKNS